MSPTPNPSIFRYAKFNLNALIEHAEELRSARCYCDASQEPMAGSHNWALVLTFDDKGEDWIFRSPRLDSGFSEETIAMMIESEVTSIQVSKLNCIPVVEVKSYCASVMNTIQIPYMLTTRAPGFSISSKFLWNPYAEGVKLPRNPLPCLPLTAKEKIMRQLGFLIAKILQSPYEQIGSLYEREGKVRVGRCLSRTLTWSGRDLCGQIARGPFSNDKDYYDSVLSALCYHAAHLPLSHHLFLAPVPKAKDFETVSNYRSAVQLWNDFATVGQKINSSKNRLDYIAMAHLMRDIIPSILIPRQKYYLKPPDLSMSNIFIDDAFNITCIIDWTSCFTVPLPTLLITPSFPHPRDDIDPDMASIFKESVIGHSSQMKDVLEDPSSWDLAQKSRLFMQLADLDGYEDYHHFIELYTSVYTDLRGTDVRGLFDALRISNTFTSQAKSRVTEDLPTSEIQRKEKEYFTHSRPGAEDLARKLSDKAGTKAGFVADCSTWSSV
ncbi:uncharacterized protein RSE6_14033 [Rhynchosporium secalis]|uniref:Aminoglycoside phosphotransferase domain-containing protein n=1 Tax=Rhynchosporium secalis TaxID=38038 RepID=A0A1E1MUB7_RHYSE|nr:uncharacterized protein RSE6_14033 [Rhynchosporium secalis]